MEAKYNFTPEELNHIQKICEASEKTGLNWIKAVSIFPARTAETRHWKERMLTGIRLVTGVPHLEYGA